MHERVAQEAAGVELGDHCRERRELLVGVRVVELVGDREVRAHTAERELAVRRDLLDQRDRVGRRASHAVHPGVDLEVDGERRSRIAPGAVATALASASIPDSVYTTGVSPCASTVSAAPAGASDSKSTGASIPASRSCTPSSTSATPSHDAPASSAARATGTAPCPYPFAFTTASTARERRCRTGPATLWRTASRSTSHHTARSRGSLMTSRRGT